ncbi:MAG: hypothetical protein WDM96_10095 [Lacunisphaera sp.]
MTLPTMVVSAARTAEPPEQVPFATTVVTADTLRSTPATMLDGALRSLPAFSLFRRSDSLTAQSHRAGRVVARTRDPAAPAVR